MGVYPNWQDDLLSADGMPSTAANVRFMNEWHANSESDCAFNPIDLTHRIAGHSSNCKATGYYNRSYQAYETRSWTRTAFAAQMQSGSYPALRAALKSGNPYTVSNTRAVADDLGKWASDVFPNVYLNDVNAGGPPPTLKAPQALKGWKDMQRSINHGMPDAMRASAHARAAALRKLAHARKVRI